MFIQLQKIVLNVDNKLHCHSSKVTDCQILTYKILVDCLL